MNWKFTHNTGPEQVLYHYLTEAGEIVVYGGDFDVLVNWSPNLVPPQIRGAVNGLLRSMKKDSIDDVQRAAFGYTSFIEPLRHKGFAVEKWTGEEPTAARYVRCPMKYDWHEFTDKHGNIQRLIYQTSMDSRIYPDKPVHEQGEQLLREYRVSVIGDDIAAVFVVDKAIVNTFANIVPSRTYCHLLEVATDEFTRVEAKTLLLYAKKQGLDIGELRVLRDNGSGRLYVIGVDHRPDTWLLNQLSDCARRDAIQRHAELIRLNGAKFVV